MNPESHRCIPLNEAQLHLCELIAAVEAGETIEIVRGGHAVALLAPVGPPKRRIDLDWLQRVTDSMPLGHFESGDLDAGDLRRRSDASRY